MLSVILLYLTICIIGGYAIGRLVNGSLPWILILATFWSIGWYYILFRLVFPA